MELIKPERLWLKSHPEINEKWVQGIIVEDPAILGLGDLAVKDVERSQPRAGRLDILLQDTESLRRYEVELQLGATDESHLVRTLEYWDIEKKRYPQYEHCAVLIAEDVTTRFLNVINLFNGYIPLIVLQMSALKIEGKLALFFTKILDEMTIALEEEDSAYEMVDRSYWIDKKGCRESAELAEKIIEKIRTLAPEVEPSYKKAYIGLKSNDRPNNFVEFWPKKSFLKVGIRLHRSDEVDTMIDDSGLAYQTYTPRDKRYRIDVTEADLAEHGDILFELIKRSYDEFGS